MNVKLKSKIVFYYQTIKKDIIECEKLLNFYNNTFSDYLLHETYINIENIRIAADACIFKCIMKLANIIKENQQTINVISFLNILQAEGVVTNIDIFKDKFSNTPYMQSIISWRDNCYAHMDKKTFTGTAPCFNEKLTTYMIKDIISYVNKLIVEVSENKNLKDIINI